MRRVLLVFAITAALLGLLAAPALASPKTFYVAPCGGNDTAHIQAAFNAAVTAGTGSTVQLAAGHFHTNNIVVNGFDGYFRGAGGGKTVIDTLRGVDPSAAGLAAVISADPCPFLFAFKGGDLRASDMSFDITAASPAEPWYSDNETDVAAVFYVTGNASSSFDRVSFRAHAGDADGYNVDVDIFIEGVEQYDANDVTTFIGPTSGTDTVSDCSFQGRIAIKLEGLTAGRMTIRDNTFNEYYTSLFSIEDSNSQIDISHNQMRCSGGDNLILAQGWVELAALPAPRYRITDNHMVATGTAGGVWLDDESWSYDNAPNRLDAAIVGNTITLDNGGMDGGIDGYYAKGIRVLGNRISGTGLAGIMVGATASLGWTPGPASGWRIIGNDVSGVTATGDQYGVSTAPIWLGPDADRCLVVGGCTPTQVLDQGTDDTLINVTPLDPPTQAARAMVPFRAAASLEQMSGGVR
jgi:hypothetical protein